MVLITNSADKLDNLTTNVGSVTAGEQVGQAIAIN
jgi:hypothetical protein